WNRIAEYLEFFDSLKLTILSTWHYTFIKINKLIFREDEAPRTQEIINQPKYSQLNELNVAECRENVSLNHLYSTLTILNIAGSSQVDQVSIQPLIHLTKLNCSGNERITNLNHL